MYGETAMTKFEEFENVIVRLRAPDGCPWSESSGRMPVGPRADTYEPEKHLYRGSRGSDLRHQHPRSDRRCRQSERRTWRSPHAGRDPRPDCGRGRAFHNGRRDPVHHRQDGPVRRHPHVFGDSDGPGTDGSQASWDEIKRQEKQGKEWTEEYLPDAFEEAKELIEAAKKRKGFDAKKAE